MPTTNRDWIELAERSLFPNYRPAPVVLVRGEGRRVWDADGRAYLDFAGGIAVTSVGHAHPRLARAIGDQAARLMHVSNLFYNDRAIALAAELTRRTGFARAFFCNSGAEANEAMLKLARRYHYGRGDRERVELVGTLGSFHGRTFGALSLTGQPKYHEGMGPLLGGVRHVAYGDLAAMREVVGPRTAAVLVEPVQGEGGIVVGRDEYLRGLRELCDGAGALLLFDEVQTGLGRTGRFLAREWSGVRPDACSLAKGIAGGFPFGAMLTTEPISGGLPPGSHATTFGGNPLACAAALAVLEIFDDEGLVAAAEARGEELAAALTRVQTAAAGAVVETRGRGLLRGLVLAPDVDPAASVQALREAGLLVTLAGGDVLRFAPALNVTRAEIDEAAALASRVLAAAPRRAATP